MFKSELIKLIELDLSSALYELNAIKQQSEKLQERSSRAILAIENAIETVELDVLHNRTSHLELMQEERKNKRRA